MRAKNLLSDFDFAVTVGTRLMNGLMKIITSYKGVVQPSKVEACNALVLDRQPPFEINLEHEEIM